jgi:hypothetical protein
MDLAEAAVGYARRSWPVLPLWWPTGDGCACNDPGCSSPGKHPCAALVPHGLNDATTDLAVVESWWSRAAANIGLRTGVAFDVLDVETLDAIDLLDARGDTTSAGPMVATGGGGFHAYFAPSGWGNRTRMDGRPIDWRGVGGYGVAPPSLHVSGRRYRWIDGPDTPLEPPPAVVADLVHPPTLAPTVAMPTPRGDSWSAHGLIGRMAVAVDGERNDVLNWCAHRVACDLADGRAPLDAATAALDHLADVARGRGLADREVARTITSAMSGRLR